MKNLISISAVLVILITIVSCKSTSTVLKIQEQSDIEVIKSFGEPVMDSTLEFTIDSASLNDNILFVQIMYTGEESDISFKLKWNGMLLKTYPPKAIIYLEPVIGEIKGKSPVIHQLYFDMSPMLPMEGYDEVIIMLKDYDGVL
ncbi:MAG: hypothetical protein C0592_00890 [Marinilabiliales bacterium]|nr:MAG: hypothetical protein C0592_00890 [Marinilabiliales bacterium]